MPELPRGPLRIQAGRWVGDRLTVILTGTLQHAEVSAGQVEQLCHRPARFRQECSLLLPSMGRRYDYPGCQCSHHTAKHRGKSALQRQSPPTLRIHSPPIVAVMRAEGTPLRAAPFGSPRLERAPLVRRRAGRPR